MDRATEGSQKKVEGRRRKKENNLISKADFHTRKMHFPLHITTSNF